MFARQRKKKGGTFQAEVSADTEAGGNVEDGYLGKREKLCGWSAGHRIKVEEDESRKGEEDVYHFRFGKLRNFILEAVECRLKLSQSLTCNST